MYNVRLFLIQTTRMQESEAIQNFRIFDTPSGADEQCL